MKNDFKQLSSLTSRNIRLYFKDKMTFFISLITPIILLVLFITFLKNTMESSLINGVQGYTLDDKLVHAFSGGWLFSSVLSVSCVTISFCSSMYVQDKLSGASLDFAVAPVKKSTLRLSYVLSNLFSTLIVCLILFVLGLIYLAIVGFYLTFTDILFILLNILLTASFGTLLANFIWNFVSSQGAVSGICTLVSSLYGFICGAYMPINSMGNAMKIFASFLPGTYSSVLFRYYYLNGVLNEISKTAPPQMVNEIAKAFDINFSFFGTEVSNLAMFLLGLATCLIFFLLLILSPKFSKNDHKKETIKSNNKKMN